MTHSGTNRTVSTRLTDTTAAELCCSEWQLEARLAPLRHSSWLFIYALEILWYLNIHYPPSAPRWASCGCWLRAGGITQASLHPVRPWKGQGLSTPTRWKMMWAESFCYLHHRWMFTCSMSTHMDDTSQERQRNISLLQLIGTACLRTKNLLHRIQNPQLWNLEAILHR